MLLDRWDTVRMRVAQQQNAIEIQMLESEQYRRMVDGYKSEQESPTSIYSIVTNQKVARILFLYKKLPELKIIILFYTKKQLKNENFIFLLCTFLQKTALFCYKSTIFLQSRLFLYKFLPRKFSPNRYLREKTRRKLIYFKRILIFLFQSFLFIKIRKKL